MQNRRIYERRLAQFRDRVAERRYGARAPLSAMCTIDKKQPIPFASLEGRSWKPITVGRRWGELWSSAWFRFDGTVPSEFAGTEVLALIDVGGEGCVFVDGVPVQGLTDTGPDGARPSHVKRRVPLFAPAQGGEPVQILVEAAANALFGRHGHRNFALRQAELAVFDREAWQFSMDVDFLLRLATNLPDESPRSQKILAALNRAANVYGDGAGFDEARAIVADVLRKRADASAPTCWSVGHAHLDLGWLWPVRETRRKAGRTFSTAIRLLSEYPDYVFGASQPQAYEWVKADYPELYQKVKEAIADDRWEPQGAMWVEPDMNIPSGESLVRQCLYGKRYFESEFGVDVDNLWLPDVFGYSAALPQILKKSGVNVFMTQKISWNETNLFPHHTFYWQGIDGTRILSHFLPSNNYNLENTPDELVRTTKNFSQIDVQDDFLNLFGIGDGGGGPSRGHIEYALRATNCEGLPKVKLAAARDFFRKIRKTDPAELPLWVGELYLELHRGTYTTQARIKRENRELEHALHDTEVLSVLAGATDRTALSRVWKDTLLHQFHDILPGSSIKEVYEDAHQLNTENLKTLELLKRNALASIHGKAAPSPAATVVYNTLSWVRDELVLIPRAGDSSPAFIDSRGVVLPAQSTEHGYLVPVTVPPMGYTTVKMADSRRVDAVTLPPSSPPEGTELSITPRSGSRSSTERRWTVLSAEPAEVARDRLENRLVCVRLAEDGTIASIYDKEHGRETLRGPANRLLLWEDYPYSWDAWDISHYYRETTPIQAELVDRVILEEGPLRVVIAQAFQIGSSTVYQRLVLEAESRMVRFECEVEWSEAHKVLRVQAEPDIQTENATYEIQFGIVSRPTHANTSWDQARFEVAGHRFVDMSQPDYGFAQLNDSKYGHYVRDGVMDLALIRSPKDPDPDADVGRHSFSYAYYPHPLVFHDADVIERAHEMNAECILWPVSKLPADPEVSHFAVDGEGVKLETVKHAEDTNSIVVRLYETRGARRRISLLGRELWDSLEETNLIEEGGKRLRFKTTKDRASRPGAESYQTSVDLEFGPFEIRTFRIVVKTMGT